MPDAYLNLSGYRMKRRFAKRRKSRRKLVILFFVVLLAAGVFAVLRADVDWKQLRSVYRTAYRMAYRVPARLASYLPGQKAKESESEEAERKPATTTTTLPPPAFDKLDLLVVGVDEAESEESRTAKSILLTRVDLPSKSITALKIPPNTFVSVPGYSFADVGSSLRQGQEAILTSVKAMLGVEVQELLFLDNQDFKRAVADLDFAYAFAESNRSSLSKLVRQQLEQAVAEFPKQQVTVIPLPVRLVSVGAADYYMPKADQIDRLLVALWGIKTADSNRTARLMILNGSGRPGVGADLARTLRDKGYTIVETKNADTFGYQQTQIIMYKVDVEAAEKLKRLLGVGLIVNRPVAQDVADFAIIIGQDLQRLP